LKPRISYWAIYSSAQKERREVIKKEINKPALGSQLIIIKAQTISPPKQKAHEPKPSRTQKPSSINQA
jgi:hypothetical protein